MTQNYIICVLDCQSNNKLNVKYDPLNAKINSRLINNKQKSVTS